MHPKTRPVILYRGDDFEENELAAAKAAGFFCTKSRMDISAFDLVIARYSCLPFYQEQEHDIRFVGGRMVNRYHQHRFIADIEQWSEHLRGITPETWMDATHIPFNENGPFVLKGETNSKKFLWDTHMFAADRSQVGVVTGRLLDDSMIGQQKICIRKYEPLKSYMTGLHGLQVTREFRFFIYDRTVISGGFYWSSHVDELREIGVSESELDPCQVPEELLKDVIDRVMSRASFYVVDVAQKIDGTWIVIELNDGQMAGLSENDPVLLYKNLRMVIDEEQDPYSPRNTKAE